MNIPWMNKCEAHSRSSPTIRGRSIVFIYLIQVVTYAVQSTQIWADTMHGVLYHQAHLIFATWVVANILLNWWLELWLTIDHLNIRYVLLIGVIILHAMISSQSHLYLDNTLIVHHLHIDYWLIYAFTIWWVFPNTWGTFLFTLIGLW